MSVGFDIVAYILDPKNIIPNIFYGLSASLIVIVIERIFRANSQKKITRNAIHELWPSILPLWTVVRNVSYNVYMFNRSIKAVIDDGSVDIDDLEEMERNSFHLRESIRRLRVEAINFVTVVSSYNAGGIQADVTSIRNDCITFSNLAEEMERFFSVGSVVPNPFNATNDGYAAAFRALALTYKRVTGDTIKSVVQARGLILKMRDPIDSLGKKIDESDILKRISKVWGDYLD